MGRAGLISGLGGALLLAGCVTVPSTPPPQVHTAPDRADRDTDVVDRDGLPAGVRIYTGEGRPAEWAELVAAAGTVDVVFLGEIHDDAVGHRVRHALASARLDAGDTLALSLEMFETDVQGVVDEYLTGLIPEDHFLRASRPWANYDPDYRPYVEMARARGIPLVAANPPRRYVNRVARLGPASLEDLPEEAFSHLPPLPFPPPSEAYRAEWDALMEGAGAHGGHGGDSGAAESMLLSQALWDAGMAWAIARTLEEGVAARVLHVAGAFHVAGGTGVPEVLEYYRPGSTTLLVVGYPVEGAVEFDPERHGSRGDFVILSPRR